MGRVRPRVVEFADVVHRHGIIAVDRPELLDAILFHIEDARAQRSAQPFVQRGAVVIAVQVRNPELEVSKCVCAIDQDRRPAVPSTGAEARVRARDWLPYLRVFE